jgi:hypothetical protein
MYPDGHVEVVADKVQFREDEDVLRYLASRGVNPNELARELLEAEVRRMRARDGWVRVRSMNVRLTRTTAEDVREDRGR